MTENEARGYIQGKLNCMNKCDVFEREDKLKYNKDICDDCEYCYSQGNFGQQKEAFEIAIQALEKQMKLNEMDDCYIIPKNGVFEVNGVDVNLAIQKQIPKKLINTCQYVSGCCPNCKKYISDWLEYNKFMCCPNCGQKLVLE